MSEISLDKASRLSAELGAATKVDLTHVMAEGMPTWPTHPSFEQRSISCISRGDVSCVHALGMSEHTGTHFDAPAHFILNGLTIDSVPAERFFGRMVTIDARSIAPNGTLDATFIIDWERRNAVIQAGDAVFFHFGWDKLWHSDPQAFLSDWPGLSGDAARLLRERHVRIAGSDCLSIDPASSTDFEAHRVLLGSGILVGENFNKLGLVPPICSLITLPLPIAGGSGAPLRAIALF